MPTLTKLAADLAAGHTTSEQLVEECLERITDPAGEGARACLYVDAEGARAAARDLDGRRRSGTQPSPYAGIPVTIKDLFDVQGQVTRAGSRVLDGTPAAQDAPAVGRWRSAGLIPIARTNMTEFAYSGLGLNPHYGTPRNPWERERSRIPGGSSSGAAVSITDGMAHGALGSDTGGSVRIPAALCGIVGFKPTQARIPRRGMVPLAGSLDAVGVLGRSVACCAILEALLAGERPRIPASSDRPPRLAIPRNFLFEETEPAVLKAFERATERLRAAGAELVDSAWPELDALVEMNAAGGLAAVESWAWHRDLIAAHGREYDPRVATRIRRGEAINEADLTELHARRAALLDGVDRRLRGYDGFACPTTPVVAPPFDALTGDEEYLRLNALVLRNPTVVNLIDGCSVSVPMHDEGEPPVGLMISAGRGQDAPLLSVASWIEERL